MSKEYYFYNLNLNEDNYGRVLNDHYQSKVDCLFALTGTYSLSRVKDYTDKKISKYKITIEKIEDIPQENYGILIKTIEEKYKSTKELKDNKSTYYNPRYYQDIITCPTIQGTALKQFLTNDNFVDYKYFTFITLEENKKIKRGNITSTIIESGKSVDVSLSKSKTNKDSYILFPTTSNNTIGIIFFKEKESYALLRLSLDTVIKFHELYEFEYIKEE